MKRISLAALALVLAAALPAHARQSTALLAPRDHQKLRDLFADYFAARHAVDYKRLTRAYEQLTKELEARAKALKVPTLLTSPADLRAVFGAPIDKPKSVKKGFVQELSGSKTLKSGDRNYKYLLRVPKDYNDKEPAPLIVFLRPDGIADADFKKMVDRLYPPEVLDTTFVLAPLKGDIDWTSMDGRMDTFFPLIDIMAQYHIDRLRLFLDGQREGAVAMVTYLTAYPGMFSGAILREMTVVPADDDLGNTAHIPLLLIAPEGAQDVTGWMNEFADAAKAKEVKADVVVSALEPGGALGAAGAEALTKFIAETRKRVAPERLRFRTTSDESVNAYWLQLVRFQASTTDPVQVEAEIDRANNEIRVVTSRGVQDFVIYLNDELVDMGKTVKVVHSFSGEGDTPNEPQVRFEGLKPRNLDQALACWFDNRAGNLGEVYTNWIEVSVAQ